MLVTGHTGFKGSWLVLWLHRMGAEVIGMALVPEHLGSLFECAAVERLCDSRIVDLRDRGGAAVAVDSAGADVIIHLAAQPLVRRSYREPVETFSINVCGTINLLDAVRLTQRAPQAVLVATTDKVYDNDEGGAPFVEDSRLGGHDPYAASKACVEIVVGAYRRSFLNGLGVAIATARGGNVIGGGDISEDRLVPDICRAICAREALKLRSPGAVRPWQHVLDCLCAYLCYAEDLAGGAEVPPSLNVGPDPGSFLTVRDVVDAMYAEFGLPACWQEIVDVPQPEARVLRLSAEAARQALGWRERLPGRIGLAWTARWYSRFIDGHAAANLIIADIERFEAAGT